MWISGRDIVCRLFSTVFLLSGVYLAGPGSHADEVSAVPLNHAHSHNDYEHPRPLLDALDHGFTSIEADVYAVDGQLLVAHDFRDISKDRTLRQLYLEPLQTRVRQHNGSVYPEGGTVILLIDIKRDGAAAFEILTRQLSEYSEMLSVWDNGQFRQNAVTIIISGDRAIQKIAAANPRYAAVDGRLTDLDTVNSDGLIPLISDNWNQHFRYRGTGEFTMEERQRLQELVRKVHSQQRKLRFWATPESEILWTELRNAGVDLIGTDDLDRLQRFLSRSASQP